MAVSQSVLETFETDLEREQSWTEQWPPIDDDHDPESLTTNDTPTTEQTTLERYADLPPTTDERGHLLARRDRPDTEQSSILEYPCPLWTDADRLERLYYDRSLSVEQIAQDVCAGRIDRETLRRKMNDMDVIDPTSPDHPQGLHNLLAESDPEDVGLSPITTDEPDEKYIRRGGV